jgi:serine/threonine protein kinase
MDFTRKRSFDNREKKPSRNVRRRPQSSVTESAPAGVVGRECRKAGGANILVAEGAFGSIYRKLRGEGNVNSLASKEIQFAVLVSYRISTGRLALECSKLQKLAHPTVAQYFRTIKGEALSVFSIDMELIEGQSLASKMVGAKAPTERESVDWARQIASALTYCDLKCVLHGDLRPENIFLTGTSLPATVKIVGFDLPCLAKAKVNVSGVKQSVYHSPERNSGLPYDSRDDVWALGCVMLELTIRTR